MGISRQAYYKRCQTEVRRVAQAEVVTTLVRDVRLRQPRLGTRKLHHLLAPVLGECGIKLGRDRLFDVLRAARLLGGHAVAVALEVNQAGRRDSQGLLDVVVERPWIGHQPGALVLQHVLDCQIGPLRVPHLPGLTTLTSDPFV